MTDAQRHGAGRVAIVTGASRGIGRAIAQRLARDGLAVVVGYSRRPEAASEVVAAIEAGGGRAIAVAADVADAGGVKGLFDAAEQAFGGIDVLVNNAGLGGRDVAIGEISAQDFERLIAVNVMGTFHGLQQAAGRMRDGGRIVNLSSSLVGFARPGTGPYAATKAAVEALTRVLAKELGTRHITVNAIAPGPVLTEMLAANRTEAQLAASAQLAPLGRIGAPDDIAGAVGMLAGPDGAWINGQTIRVNGGYI